MKSLRNGFVIVIFFLVSAASLEAQTLRNTITFDNQSGDPALVKLVGPTAQAVEVPNGEKRSVNVAAGEYYLLARYGADPERYTYSRWKPFKVEETATQYSAITITLHNVVGGKYPTRTSTGAKFEAALSDSTAERITGAEGSHPEIKTSVGPVVIEAVEMSCDRFPAGCDETARRDPTSPIPLLPTGLEFRGDCIKPKSGYQILVVWLDIKYVGPSLTKDAFSEASSGVSIIASDGSTSQRFSCGVGRRETPEGVRFGWYVAFVGLATKSTRSLRWPGNPDIQLAK